MDLRQRLIRMWTGPPARSFKPRFRLDASHDFATQVHYGSLSVSGCSRRDLTGKAGWSAKPNESEHRLDPRRRSGLRRPWLLRTEADFDAQYRSPRSTRAAVHAVLCRFDGLCAVALRVNDGAAHR